MVYHHWLESKVNGVTIYRTASPWNCVEIPGIPHMPHTLSGTRTKTSDIFALVHAYMVQHKRAIAPEVAQAIKRHSNIAAYHLRSNPQAFRHTGEFKVLHTIQHPVWAIIDGES